MESYLGVGIKYPIQIVNGKPALSYGEDNIKQSLFQLLSTPVGSRLFLPEYGSRLDEALFEQNDEVLKALLQMFIVEAIELWERRIKLKKVSYTQENNVILCEITYNVLASNEINSFVYPFYRELIY